MFRKSSFLNLLLNHFLYLNFVDYRYFKSDVTVSRNSIFHKVSRAYHPRRKCLSAKDHVQQGEKIQIEHKKLKSVSGVISIVVCNMVHKKRDNLRIDYVGKGFFVATFGVNNTPTHISQYSLLVLDGSLDSGSCPSVLEY